MRARELVSPSVVVIVWLFFRLLCKYHRLSAVHTHYVYLFGSSYAVMTTRTDVLAVVAVGVCSYGYQSVAVASVCPYSNGYDRGVSSAHFYLSEFVMFKYKVDNKVGWVGAAVAVFGLGNNQPMRFGFFLELLVVVCAFVACVGDIQTYIIVHMHHFMDE